MRLMLPRMQREVLINRPGLLRALSRQKEGGGQELSLSLAGAEASDYLNFVIKDESTGIWCGATPACHSRCTGFCPVNLR